MTTNGRKEEKNPPVEERAEELVARVVSDVSRTFTRFAGRAREELEDIYAEARTLHDRWRATGSQ